MSSGTHASGLFSCVFLHAFGVAPFCTLIAPYLRPNCTLIAPFNRLTFCLFFLLDYGFRFFKYWLANGSGSCWVTRVRGANWPWIPFLACPAKLCLTSCVCWMIFICRQFGNMQHVLPFWIFGPAVSCRTPLSLVTSWCSSLKCVWIPLLTLCWYL